MPGGFAAVELGEDHAKIVGHIVGSTERRAEHAGQRVARLRRGDDPRITCG